MTVRSFRFIALACALSVPATAATTAEAPADAQFASSFAKFEALPASATTPQHAVDLDTFDPPIEEEPAASSLGSGVASYYGRRFHGRMTASGERFDMNALTAAHRTLPFGSVVRVTNPRSGKSVTVRINDRGPFTKNRTIDLSRAAASEIGLISRGHGTVELELLD